MDAQQADPAGPPRQSLDAGTDAEAGAGLPVGIESGSGRGGASHAEAAQGWEQAAGVGDRGHRVQPHPCRQVQRGHQPAQRFGLKVGLQHNEYAGSFGSVASSSDTTGGGGTLEGKLTLVLDDVLADIGAGGDTVDVVLVPRAGDIKVNLP